MKLRCKTHLITEPWGDIRDWRGVYGTVTTEKDMTRNKSGTVVPQCEAQYVREVNHVRCVKENGHDGEHTDARGEWNEKTEREPSEDSG